MIVLGGDKNGKCSIADEKHRQVLPPFQGFGRYFHYFESGAYLWIYW